ncbi:MAG: hypothetical protein IPK22_00090 [Verrucomicrobiaceae bacterium]|nr:hypothetical protein [Verrucomicrobiaceae bacterium]
MKLIVFVGAGVSVPSKLPKVDELTQRIFHAPYHQDHKKNFVAGEHPDAKLRRKDPTLIIRSLLIRMAEYDKRVTSSVFRGAPNYEDLFTLCKTITLYHHRLADNSIPTSFIESIERATRPIFKKVGVKPEFIHLGHLHQEASRFIEAVVVDALQSNSVVGMQLILELAKLPSIEQLNIVTLNHDTFGGAGVEPGERSLCRWLWTGGWRCALV